MIDSGLADYGYVLDMATNSWHYWTEYPGHALLRADHVATPGIYACGYEGLHRLLEGFGDDGATVLWDWITKEFSLEGREGDVQRVVFWGRSAGQVETIVAEIYVNGGATGPEASLSVPLDDDVPRAKRWRPAPIGDVNSFQVKLSGEADGDLEITRLEIEVAQKGAVR